MRPDLFKAAVLMVPFVDVVNTMLDASLPLTVQEFPFVVLVRKITSLRLATLRTMMGRPSLARTLAEGTKLRFL